MCTPCGVDDRHTCRVLLDPLDRVDVRILCGRSQARSRQQADGLDSVNDGPRELPKRLRDASPRASRPTTLSVHRNEPSPTQRHNGERTSRGPDPSARKAANAWDQLDSWPLSRALGRSDLTGKPRRASAKGRARPPIHAATKTGASEICCAHL